MMSMNILPYHRVDITTRGTSGDLQNVPYLGSSVHLKQPVTDMEIGANPPQKGKQARGSYDNSQQLHLLFIHGLSS
jgi:hypothetical protein